MAKIVILGIDDEHLIQQLRERGHEARVFKTEKSVEDTLYSPQERHVLTDADIVFTALCMDDTLMESVGSHIGRLRCFNIGEDRPFAGKPFVVLARFDQAKPLPYDNSGLTTTIRVPEGEQAFADAIIAYVRDKYPRSRKRSFRAAGAKGTGHGFLTAIRPPFGG